MRLRLAILSGALSALALLAAPAFAATLPTVATLDLHGPITDTGARAIGTVNPNGVAVSDCHFEYGPTESYGSTAPCDQPPGGPGAGTEALTVSAPLSNLQPNTTYHYRLVAADDGAPAQGADQTLSTAETPAPEAACPNAAARAQAQEQYLPDCRGYTLVSPPRKNGAAIQHAAISPAGDRVQFQLIGGPDGGSLGAPFLSVWNGSGWDSHSLLPPYPERPYPAYAIEARTPELTRFFAAVTEGVPGGGRSPTAEVSLDSAGHQEVLETLAPEYLRGSASLIASADGSHVFANLLKPIDPEQATETFDVYDLTQRPPLLVSRLPNGTVPDCGVFNQRGFAAQTVDSTSVQNWASADGSRVFFLSRGNDAGGGCTAPLELYQRDLSGPAPQTRLISGPALAGDSDATFLQANATGTEAVYETAAKLAPGDENGHPDVYRWTLGAGSACLTCAVADANPIPAPESSAGFSASIAVSTDLSHVYFLSAAALAPGASAGAVNLYVWHVNPSSGPGGRIDYVSPASQLAGSRGVGLENNPLGANAELTPDGDSLLFSSSAQVADPQAFATLTGADGGGFHQYYLYDDRGRSLTCVSCPVGHPAAAGANKVLAVPFANVDYARAISDDGDRVFFMTNDSLVPRDENHARDVYEWDRGRVGLISDGVSVPSAEVNEDLFEGASASGDDVLLRSFSALLPEAADGSSQLYDARVGAGPLAPPPPAVCEGEACKGAAAGPPAPPAISHLSGPGNPGPERRCPRGRHARTLHGKTRCVKRARRHRHRGHHRRPAHHRRAAR